MTKTIGLGAALAAALFAQTARADCAIGQSYEALEVESSVLVCLSLVSSFPLLRQDADAGTVVRLSATCAASSDLLGDAGIASTALNGLLEDGGEAGACCFEDDCVEPGSYRYGLSTPTTCPNGCNGEAAYWVEATVTAPLDGGCMSASPVVFTNGAPWPGNGQQEVQCSCGGCSTAGSVLGVDALLGGLALALLYRRRTRP